MLGTSSCAFRNPDNTPLTRWTERKLGLEDAGPLASVAFVPLALPLGLVDIVVVHPMQVLDDAYVDTVQDLWQDRNEGTATESYFLLPRVACTPLRYTGSWVARSLFDIDPALSSTQDESTSEEPPQEPPPSERESLERDLEQLRQDLERSVQARERTEERIRRTAEQIEQVEQRLRALPEGEGGPDH